VGEVRLELMVPKHVRQHCPKSDVGQEDGWQVSHGRDRSQSHPLHNATVLTAHQQDHPSGSSSHQVLDRLHDPTILVVIVPCQLIHGENLWQRARKWDRWEGCDARNWGRCDAGNWERRDGR